ncbi:hypothetical protein PAXINDRAFT_158954 [Paxillus involutus ATCC 200175]|uniref:Uncharacterized protein n=1 Tax=Paxillus involutus ATCC 200175 TaxID=664439 RepID=A0A0C9STX1_PAXIN|nr:hypothetical protein PAXINDRAFT_158954 [Paxillus involutus ATCC 200175]
MSGMFAEPAGGPSRARAMSPAQAGYVQGSVFAVLDESKAADGAGLNPRLATLSLTSSFGEVMGLVPNDYREALRPEMRALSDLATKRVSVENGLAKLKRHKAAGTLPPQLAGLHIPVWQVTKEFSNAAHDHLDEMKEAFEKYRADALSAAIVLKETEVEHLGGFLSGEIYFPPMVETINKVFDLNSEKFKVAVLSNDGVAVQSWSVSPDYVKTRDRLLADLPHFCIRILILERTRQIAAEKRDEAKIKLKQTADIEMADGTGSNVKVEDLIQRSLEAQLKKMGIKGNASGKPAGQKKGQKAKKEKKKTSSDDKKIREIEAKLSKMKSGRKSALQGHPNAQGKGKKIPAPKPSKGKGKQKA